MLSTKAGHIRCAKSWSQVTSIQLKSIQPWFASQNEVTNNKTLRKMKDQLLTRSRMLHGIQDDDEAPHSISVKFDITTDCKNNLKRNMDLQR